jgi:uncharacterized protein YjbJ (UPF0337 family)
MRPFVAPSEAPRAQGRGAHPDPKVEDVMHGDNLKRQGKGTAQTFFGRIWSALGRMFGSHRMQAEGIADEVRGRANVETGKAGERLEGSVEEARGMLENAAGEMMGKEGTAAKGREVEGRYTNR